MNEKYIISLIQQAQQRELENSAVFCEKKLGQIQISALKKPTYNKRVIVESRLKQLIFSLSDYGFLGGIFVQDTTLNVIEGWHRCELWKELGHDIVPYFNVYCDSIQAAALHLKLNQQTAIFNPAEFGLEFEGLDLINDYGFSEADILPVVLNSPTRKENQQKEDPDGLTKLSVLVKLSTMKKLKEIQQKNHLSSIAEVVDSLIEKL